jgi:tetratricopeptide (TPR) repeat protein/CHAT domain-containing protein
MNGWGRGAALLVPAALLLGLSLMPAQAQAEPPELEAISKRGSQLYQAGKYADAIPVVEEYIAAAAAKFGEEHPLYADAADLLHHLAEFYRKDGRLAEAEPLYQRALSIAERVLDPEHPSISIALGNLAELYRAQGRHAEAEPLAERSLAIREKASRTAQANVGPEPDETANLLSKVNQLYRAGKYVEAIPIAERYAQVIEARHGTESPEYAIALNDLGELLRVTNRFAEAEPLMRRALAIDERSRGPKHPIVAIRLNNLALLLQATNRLGEAEPLFKRALELREKALPVGHAHIAQSLNNLAELYRTQDRLGEAEPLHRRALEIYEKALPAGHPDIAGSLNNLALLFQAQKRYVDAEPLFKRALELREQALSVGHAHIAQSLNNLAELYRTQDRLGEAEPLHRRALEIYEKALPAGHPDIAGSLNNLALLLQATNRLGEAEPLFKRALELREKTLPAGHAHIAQSLNNLAELYRAQGRYADAEPPYKRSVAINEKALGRDHPELSKSVGNLAELYRAQGRYAEAEPLYQRALFIAEKTLGPDHPDIATTLANLGQLYQLQDRYGDAESLYKRALTIYERAFGPEHSWVGTALNNLASLYQAQGRYSEAEPLFARTIAITEKALGPEHPHVGVGLSNLAELYRSQGRYFDAEPLHKRALAIKEKALGPDHPDVATSLNNLAGLYVVQGRYAEAAPIFARTTSIFEKALGPDHPALAKSLNNLAEVYRLQGRYADAEQRHKNALAMRERALGPDHTDVGTSLSNLALVYHAQGRHAEAEPALQRALRIYEKALGPDHPDVGRSLNNLALVYQAQSRHAEAESVLQRSLRISEKALGPDHPNLTGILGNLAALHFVERRWAQTSDYLHQSTGLIIRRSNRTADTVGQPLIGPATSEAVQASDHFAALVKVLYLLAAEVPGRAWDHARETFITAQWARSSATAISLAQFAARSAKGNATLSREVRERQDLVGEWQKRDGARSAAVSQAPDKRDRVAEAENVARLTAIDTRIAEIDQRLKTEFPEYAALSRPVPLSVAEVQADLLADEALVLFLNTPEWKPTPEETFIWAVTKTDMRWVRSGLGTKALTERIDALRCGLDRALWWDATDWKEETEKQRREKAEQFALRRRCAELLKTEPVIETVKAGDKQRDVQVLPYDLAGAYELHKALLGPVEDMIKDKKLLIVPSGPLTGLPFNVLVTDAPKTEIPGKLADYRDVAWLGARTPVTVLPSVASLKALREHAKTSRATKLLIGFGNPLLDGNPQNPFEVERARKARDWQHCPEINGQRVGAVTEARIVLKPPTRGGLADVAHVRAQAPLPETAKELCDVARDLGVPESDIRLGARATERDIKAMSEDDSLSTYRIVHFATHGALASEAQEKLGAGAEPGLILTPPDKATPEDDGYLSASEIAGLKLDADWVILSACNTAAGGAQGAEALSGLARAFFYAGARALLVSHWAVDSESTVKLINTTIRTMAGDKSIGRAEALRQSMLALIEKGAPHEAHPAYWAPFVVVGEGGAANSVSSPSVTSAPVQAKKTVSKPRHKAREDWAAEFWKQRN